MQRIARAIEHGKRRAVACLTGIAVAAVVGTAALLPGSAAAQSGYPNQPIKLLVPYAPGGVADIVARVVAQKLSEQMKQQVLVDNRPSAGQTIATEVVRTAEPDGYTLLWLNQGHAVSASLFKSLPYDPIRDFAPIASIGLFSLALVVDSNSKYKSAQEMLAFSKANPGKLNIGTTSVGSGQFMTAELLKSMTGANFQIVPFKATPQIITAIKSGDLDGSVEIVAPLMSHIKSGNLRALGITLDKRLAGLPDVPTLAESGVAGFEASAWNGMAAPAKTPRPIIERLNKEVNAVLAQPDVRQRLSDLGIEPRGGTPEQLRDYLAADVAKWKKVVETAKIERQ